MNRTLRLACLQMTSGPTVEENLRFVEQQLESAPDTDLLFLPENFAQMPRSRLEMHTEVEGAGPVQQALANLARQSATVIVAGSVAIRSADSTKPTARCLVYGQNGQCLAHYDKLHLFDVDTGAERNAHYRESDTYQAGDLSALQTRAHSVKIDGSTVQLGLTICYDLRFPELYRTLTDHGAEIISVPAAFTFETGQAHWETLLRSRAIENQVFIAAAAQVGKHANGRRTWGQSIIIDPWGKVLAQQSDGLGLVFADIDLTSIERLRKRFPVHQHKRL